MVLRLAACIAGALAVSISAPAPAGAQIPTDFPPVAVTLSGNPAPGYLFLSDFALDRSVSYVPYLMVLDNSGYPVRCKKLNSPINTDFKLQPDGTLTYCDATRFVILDQNLETIGTLQAAGGWNTDAHELRIQPDGHAYLLAWRARTADMTAYGGRRNALVQDCAIQELDTNGALVWQWDTAAHFQVSDATSDIDLTAAYIDYVHCNAIDIDTDGNILLSSRHFDEVTKISRTTGGILWRLGGKECKNNQFRFANDFIVDQGDTLFYGFSHQHGLRRLANGHIILFDNGNLKNPHFSRAVEYQIDEVNRIATKIWEYRRSPDVASDEMGFAQRFDNGNTLVAWGGNSGAVALTEVRPDGTPLVEMSLPAGVFSYRALRFVYAMAAVTRSISGPGHYDFDATGNVTSVSLDLQRVTGSGSMTVQRHDYAAHDSNFDLAPEEVYSYRWIVTQTGLSGLDARFDFDLATLPGAADAARARVYSRPQEGTGEFRILPTTYDPGAGRLEAHGTGLGEFVIGALSPTDVGPAGGESVLRFEQSRPNPSRLAAVLRFQLARRSRVRLCIFDAAGKEVAMLVDAERAAGSHEVVFDAGRSGSGVYFCRLEAGGRVVSSRIVLLR